MEKNDFIRLNHMLEAARTCIQFSVGKARIDFEKDQMLSFAVIDFKKTHPNIPWRAIVGMRNRLIHAYFDIDYDVVFQAIKNEIPKIIPELEKLLAKSY